MSAYVDHVRETLGSNCPEVYVRFAEELERNASPDGVVTAPPTDLYAASGANMTTFSTFRTSGLVELVELDGTDVARLIGPVEPPKTAVKPPRTKPAAKQRKSRRVAPDRVPANLCIPDREVDYRTPILRDTDLSSNATLAGVAIGHRFFGSWELWASQTEVAEYMKLRKPDQKGDAGRKTAGRALAELEERGYLYAVERITNHSTLYLCTLPD